MNILRKSVVLIFLIIMLSTFRGVAINESLAAEITKEELDYYYNEYMNADKEEEEAFNNYNNLLRKKKKYEKDNKTYSDNYYKVVEDTEKAFEILQRKKISLNYSEYLYGKMLDQYEKQKSKKTSTKKTKETKKTNNTTKKESETTTTTKKASTNKTKTEKAKTSTTTMKNTISDDVPKIDCYKFVLNRGPRINKLTSDKNGVTLELNDGDPISGIFVYKTEKEVRTTKDKDTKVSNENKTLKILKSVIGKENKFKIVLKDKNGNNSKFYLIAKKDGNTFKTNRSPKITEITGFGDKDYNGKDEAKANSMITLKIADGSKTLKNVVIYDNEKEVSRVENVSKGENKVFLTNDYCKIYSKAGEDFIRLDVYTKKFEMKDSQINVRVKATDGEGLPTVEHLNMKLVKR